MCELPWRSREPNALHGASQDSACSRGTRRTSPDPRPLLRQRLRGTGMAMHGILSRACGTVRRRSRALVILALAAIPFLLANEAPNELRAAEEPQAVSPKDGL